MKSNMTTWMFVSDSLGIIICYWQLLSTNYQVVWMVPPVSILYQHSLNSLNLEKSVN